MGTSRSGILALEDGSVFRGKAFGAAKTVVGEAVFNTSMTGYQEILTDPSYYAQIVTMTASQIGNYGINPEDEESNGPKVKAFVVRDLSPVSSNWRSTMSLPEYLEKNFIPGLAGVDTRSITKRLRVDGAMKACLSTEDISDEEAVTRAKEWSGLIGIDYVKDVTCKEPYAFDPDGSLSELFKITGTTMNHFTRPEKTFKVAAFDFGAKHSIFKRLRNHGFDVFVVPATATPEQVNELRPDAIFLSNGPGDPAAVTYAHQSVSKLIEQYPTFGICLGHQIITHALGAKTFKLKFGHRGGNQPVKNIETGLVSITSQNHGFASTPDEIEKCGGVVTEINLNDNTVEGLRHKDLPVFSVQYHPEAAPGPNDADPLFTQFYEMVAKAKG
ncbi:glutamine-hydrolyzing carbamoyl-phosphate synthase small subunit [Ruficoccus amylovorans]|uniref:Carbamoyl phosphate synthase small chain n=1 Tax=Ruficoccus amylovorans TaxID=1804625 RepID=A0A842HH64_9BACT|nr:glutamine-hydrolyzing carbamoyl-phosphate synthase small subunit [Ruficoccus amylovorans]MBC2595338.1 glutamine-hydrolyzing carbamoyl-phosphate synthase small subunit [Ruficoccus amylovorans]